MKRFCALAILLCLCLTGCSWMDGSYVSVHPHQVDYNPTAEDIPTVSDYSQLRSAIADMISAGQSEGLFYLVDYELERAQADIPLVVAYARENDPIGSYAVKDISYTFGTSGSLNALLVTITYRRSQTEISQICTVREISGAMEEIAQALDACDDSLVLMVTGYEDADFAELIDSYAAEHPDVVMEVPQTTVQIYPDSGTIRVVEIQFSYQTSRSSLRQMQEKVEPIFSSAALYVSADADDLTKYSQLYAFLMERFDYQIETSLTPAYSLLYHGVGDSKAFAQVYAAMCRQIGLECITVSGTGSGASRFWNIILVDGAYYHVDLLSSAQNGQFRTCTDAEMTGYVWDYSAYPACG